MQKASFAAGCFWGVELTFSRVPGVLSTKVGYSGGHTVNPSYEQVCNGDTGHAESIEVEFDPNKVSYQELLEIFWHMHNPTTLNRQGPDIGTQYRSAIFYHNEQQKQLAFESMQVQQQQYMVPITTEISAATQFYPAEEYHQRYLEKNGGNHC